MHLLARSSQERARTHKQQQAQRLPQPPCYRCCLRFTTAPVRSCATQIPSWSQTHSCAFGATSSTAPGQPAIVVGGYDFFCCRSDVDFLVFLTSSFSSFSSLSCQNVHVVVSKSSRRHAMVVFLALKPATFSTPRSDQTTAAELSHITFCYTAVEGDARCEVVTS